MRCESVPQQAGFTRGITWKGTTFAQRDLFTRQVSFWFQPRTIEDDDWLTKPSQKRDLVQVVNCQLFPPLIPDRL